MPLWAFAAFKALVETARTLGALLKAVRFLRCARRGLLLISPLPPAPDILLAWLFNFKELNLSGDARTAGGQGERTRLQMDQMQCPRGRECRGKGRGHGVPRCVLIAAASPPNPRNLFRKALYQLLNSADLKIYMHTTLQICLGGALRMGFLTLVTSTHSTSCTASDALQENLVVSLALKWALRRRLSSDSSLPSSLTQKVAGASRHYWCNGGSL
jgi:hypothetical protein